MEARITISEGLSASLEQLKQLPGDDRVMRMVATSLLGHVHDRIHEKGLNANGTPIGTYSTEYMKVRTGNFGNSERFTKGKKKGEVKNAGEFTRGKNKGQPRPNYNRTSDTKVVISLTRQMENDFKVVATDRGYGLGYSNLENLKKADYVEETYNEEIFSLTEEETDLAVEIATQEVLKIFE